MVFPTLSISEFLEHRSSRYGALPARTIRTQTPIACKKAKSAATGIRSTPLLPDTTGVSRLPAPGRSSFRAETPRRRSHLSRCFGRAASCRACGRVGRVMGHQREATPAYSRWSGSGSQALPLRRLSQTRPLIGHATDCQERMASCGCLCHVSHLSPLNDGPRR